MRNTQQKPTENRAYVLIDAEESKASEVAAILHNRSGITMADVVNGPYRVIAVVEDSNISAIAKTILIDIKKLSGVRDIIVYLATPDEQTNHLPSSTKVTL